jgi:hypothetical protein
MPTEAGDKTYQTAQEGPREHPRKPPKPDEAAKWAMVCHLAALAGFIVPFGNIVGPLIVWLAKRKVDGFVDRQGKEAINFQISMIVYSFVAAFIPAIGMLIIFLIAVTDLVLLIMAGVRAKGGMEYRYPLAFRLIK